MEANLQVDGIREWNVSEGVSERDRQVRGSVNHRKESYCILYQRATRAPGGYLTALSQVLSHRTYTGHGCRLGAKVKDLSQISPVSCSYRRGREKGRTYYRMTHRPGALYRPVCTCERICISFLACHMSRRFRRWNFRAHQRLS